MAQIMMVLASFGENDLLLLSCVDDDKESPIHPTCWIR